MNEVTEKEYSGILNEYTTEIEKNEMKQMNELLDKYSKEQEEKEENNKEYNKLLEEISNPVNMKNIKAKSVVNNSIVRYDRNKKINMLKEKVTIKSVAVVLACITALSVAPTIYNEVSYYSDSKNIIEQVSMEASSKLSSSGLFIVPDPVSKEWKNDYSKIENLSEDDLYGMFKYLGTSESEKVVQALGYTGWDNYLSINGYFNVDGEPSIIVYDNMMESKLVREYRDGKENGRSY